MLFKDECSECDQVVAANDPTTMGFNMAVHLHDEHPDEFEELAESAREMNEIAAEDIDDADMGRAGDIVKNLLGMGGRS